jgi:hypothetical protein
VWSVCVGGWFRNPYLGVGVGCRHGEGVMLHTAAAERQDIRLGVWFFCNLSKCRVESSMNCLFRYVACVAGLGVDAALPTLSCCCNSRLSRIGYAWV